MKGTEALKKILHLDQVAAGGATNFFADNHYAATMVLDPTKSLSETKGTAGGAVDFLGATRVAGDAMKETEELNFFCV